MPMSEAERLQARTRTIEALIARELTDHEAETLGHLLRVICMYPAVLGDTTAIGALIDAGEKGKDKIEGQACLSEFSRRGCEYFTRIRYRTPT